MTDTQTARLTTRWATMDDLPALKAVMQRAIDSLQSDVLTPEQVIASHAVMGLDTQLIRDGTYLIAERKGEIAGCGGWSNRATLFGGDHSTDLRNPELLDPARDPAKIRAMYTDPAHVRQGVGKLVLKTCEEAAAAAGFTSVEMMATLAGERLYAVAGYHAIERVEVMAGEVALPLVRMRKAL
ncbi:GNAT family N-acetyltransferase [Aurantiacibacter xanthus]|uniref:GNAT family N-acetyltransferase n=1 Tax=Aurantiacibacter xanthus TaxID=1784712 RepID=A0A3A1PG62_9SPHN|nr:GNAT family N-acetyltransferase [Aurantiacibacter xanthus]RIV92836.1 GNAT family N-acetyltransferase [Aurantiacibacter xanthus]